MHMYSFIVYLALMAACVLAAAIPDEANSFIVTLPDGTMSKMRLPAGVTFVPSNGTSTTSSLVKRLEWHPGSDSDKCGDPYDPVDMTTSGSPLTEDCKWIADVLDQDKNKGWFLMHPQLDWKPDGDWCRVWIHSTCVFGAKSRNMWATKIGTDDIRDTIRERMAANDDGKTIQWEGKMKCENTENRSTLFYAIFKNT